MAKKEIIPVEIQVDASGANKELGKTQSSIKGVINSIGDGLKKAGSSFLNLGKTIGGGVVKAFTSLKVAAAAVNFGAIIELVKKLYENWESIQKVITNFIPGFGKFVNLVKGLVQNFTDFIGLTSEAERTADALVKQTERQNEALDDQIKVLQAVGGQEAEIYKIQKAKNENELNSLRERIRLLGELTEEEQKRFRELKTEQAVLDASEKKRIEDSSKQAADKAKADAKARADKAKAERDAENQRIKEQADRETEAQKILINIYRENLSERQRAILEAEDKTEQERVALIQAGIYNFEQLEEQKRIRIAEINKQFDEKEEEERKAKEEKEKEKLQGLIDYLRSAREANQNYELELQTLNAKTEDEKRLADIAKVELDYQKKLELAKKNGEDIVLIEQLKQAEINRINETYAEADKKTKEAKTESDIAMAQNALSIIGGFVDQNSAVGKGVAVAQAIINTYQGATKALAQGGMFGSIAAAATIAAGMLQVKKIVSTKIPSVGGKSTDKGGTPAAGGGSAPIAPTPNVQATLTQLDQSTVNRLGSASARAYVVESDVTNNQEKIRRINRAARLS